METWGKACLVRGLLSQRFGLIAVLAFLLVFPAAGWAQRSAAAINGTVKDPSGAVIPQATVMLTNTETNVSQTAITDNTGEYVIPEIRPGTYVLKVQTEGFKSVTQPAFTLQVNQTTPLISRFPWARLRKTSPPTALTGG